MISTSAIQVSQMSTTIQVSQLTEPTIQVSQLTEPTTIQVSQTTEPTSSYNKVIINLLNFILTIKYC